LRNFFVTFIFEAAALPSGSSSVSDKTLSAKSYRFFFFHQARMVYSRSIASYKIDKIV